MASGGRVAAAAVGGLLAGAGKALQITAEQKFQEKMERLRQQTRTQERAEDRSWQTERDDRQAKAIVDRDTAQADATAKRDAAQNKAENDRLERSLKAQSERNQADLAAKGDLIEEEDGTLSRVGADGKAVKVTRDGVAVKGKKMGTSATPREGLTAEHQRMVNLAMSNAGIPDGVAMDDTDKAAVAAELTKLKAPSFLVAVYQPPKPEPKTAPGSAVAAEEPKPPAKDGAETAPGADASAYKSAEDVRAAMRAGKITREEAAAILVQQFGFQ